MPSLRQILSQMGVEDPNKVTDEQLEEASRILREQQQKNWGEAGEWGLTEKTPSKQARKDEQANPSNNGENKG